MSGRGWGARVNWIAIWVTCKLAGLTALALLFVAFPSPIGLVFRLAVEIFGRIRGGVALVLPPTVLGFYILIAIGPHSPLEASLHRASRPSVALHL